MNSETRLIIDECIKDAGAVTPCDICGNYDVWADDDDAEKLAYAYVTQKWKDGAFRGEGREAIMEQVKLALNDVNLDCPGCCHPM
ncbi:MAG: hypothetical protein KGZ72_10055 [Roseovarius sp.]|jgi:hypothetical protein|nr:hypothetical protein [Roseovarius sp.]